MSNPKKILIIEDDPAMIKILSATLTKEGFTVRQAIDGKQGYDMALQEIPDLLLLDLLLPTMSGLEILRALHKNTGTRTLPILILTNLNENDEIYQAASKASLAYIIKSNSSLQSIVQEVKQQLHIVT